MAVISDFPSEPQNHKPERQKQKLAEGQGKQHHECR
jgi:hypothetical protein